MKSPPIELMKDTFPLLPHFYLYKYTYNMWSVSVISFTHSNAIVTLEGKVSF